MTNPQYGEIYKQVIRLLEEYAPRPVPISEETELVNDLGFDSLRVMEMLHDVEDTFDISYPLNSLPELRTVKDFTLKIQEIIETT
ncbi:MAG: acyl carrier protein [Desulfuromonadales bacterium]